MKYIKYSCVVFIQSNEKSVCAICIPDLISTSLNWEYLDTDEDGIPDIYEKEFGTDPNKADTDDDGLTDYEEIYLTDTDPLVYNSFNENLSDSDADSDSDGITNRKEIDIGTNPLNPDTDGDGVSDGEELKIGTDPLKYDTDGDGIGDGDELILGLDPTSETTDGIKDCERMTVQEIAEDSDVMSEINTEENPMKVSIEFEAAGLAESSLDVSESGYSSAMNNSAIVGSTPEFSYPEGLAVGDVTIKFNVSDSVKSNTVGDYAENCEELQGIKRFNVFRYFEEINMLLPIETFHDEEQGVVYTKTDCLGTYCVMDLEIWMQNLGVEPELETDEDSTQVSAQYLNAEAETETVKENEKLNVVFFLDTRKSVDYEEFSDMKNIVNDTLKIIIDNTVSSENPERILNINNPILCTQLSDEKLKYYSIISDSEIEKVVSGIKQETKSSDSEAIFDITSALGLLMDEYDDSETVLFIVTSKEKIMARSDMSKNIYRHLQHSENIHVSFVSRDMKPATNSYVENIAKASDGKIFADFDVEEIKNYIWSYSDVAANNYKIITANNYETITLDSVLRKNSGTDTDKDKLSDWQEINTELIERLKPGAADKGYLTMDDMPTISDIIIAIGRNDGTLEINESSSALKNFIKKYGSTPYHALLSPVTPIKSNPIDADSDNDGVIDYNDTESLDADVAMLKDFDKEENCEGQDKVFTVVKILDNKFPYMLPQNAKVFYQPFFDGEVAEKKVNDIKKVLISSIVFSDNAYWLKVNCKDRFYYIHQDHQDVYTQQQLDEYYNNKIIRDYKKKNDKVLANLDYIWYKVGNISYYPQCPWYVYGRIEEVLKLKLEFKSVIDVNNVSRTASGGWWMKTANSIAKMVRVENDQINTIEHPAVKVNKITESLDDLAQLKPRSVAVFLCFFYADKERTDGDFYGHVVFIEAIEVDGDKEKEGNQTYVYYSDSYAAKATKGQIVRKSLEDFCNMYSSNPNYNGEPILQGYLQFEHTPMEVYQ